jgi:hypothetical protein
MKVLVLDTVHGGMKIGAALEAAGLDVDIVDVYRNSSPVDTETALMRSYDLVVAPVHLDPGHPLIRSKTVRVISHHEAVRWLLADTVPRPMIEITGKQGKTTTASALAAIMPGPGVLLSSRGMIRYPEQQVISRISITPASVLSAAKLARQNRGWLVAEESLGVTGAGDLAVLTSGETYPIAAGKRDALYQKLVSLRSCKNVLLAPGIPCDLPHAVHLGDVVKDEGCRCEITIGSRTASFSNGLLETDAYKIPLMLAGAAACMLGIDPGPLRSFTGVTGRMSIQRERDILIIDNANSGTTAETTIAAARCARRSTGSDKITLVIGIEPGDGKVCGGFPDDEIADAIRQIRPYRLILVGSALDPPFSPPEILTGTYIHRAPTLAEGKAAALSAPDSGSVVLAVKTWR